MDDLLYKYRGIQSFRFFVDIILKNRLYASKYTNLNDPMEGQYLYDRGTLNHSIRQKILSSKGELRLCSLSRVRNNELMWSHYAEGHHGVAIGLSIDKAKYDTRPIQYSGLAYLKSNIVESDTPREILSHKLEVWSYEEEERVFVRDKLFIDIEIKQIITGRSMSNQDYGFIKELLEKINPSISLIKAETFM